jgi:AraC-like DNA-binding protein
MEMIFHYGDRYKQYTSNGNFILQPRCFVIGQLTRPLKIEPTGKTGIFSVRFYPNGFQPFSDVPIKELENTAVPLQRIFGREGEQIAFDILEANSNSNRINRIETFLLTRLTHADTVDRIVESAVDTIFTANGKLSVNELSSQKNINRRQLVRKFSQAIGLSPKQLSKTIRLQATLKMLLSKQVTSLTAIAYENDYYDQAHFIKDFKEFTGYTPKDFYGQNLKMSSIFYGSD